MSHVLVICDMPTVFHSRHFSFKLVAFSLLLSSTFALEIGVNKNANRLNQINHRNLFHAQPAPSLSFPTGTANPRPLYGRKPLNHSFSISKPLLSYLFLFGIAILFFFWFSNTRPKSKPLRPVFTKHSFKTKEQKIRVTQQAFEL